MDDPQARISATPPAATPAEEQDELLDEGMASTRAALAELGGKMQQEFGLLMGHNWGDMWQNCVKIFMAIEQLAQTVSLSIIM